MADYFKKLPPELKNIIVQAAKVSRETGMPAYLVGGCLRDLILGVPNLDLDIAVEGDGIIFARRLCGELKSALTVHERFRTATLSLPGGLKLDVATARRESYPAFASLPVVRPGPLAEDLKRRDFTINAMAVNIAGGKRDLIDPFGGRKDLSARRIRILHDLSFKEDPTRILRAVRFSRRFRFRIESKTLLLMKEALKEGWLEKVTPHRLRDELVLMLKEKDVPGQLKTLSVLRGLDFIGAGLKFTPEAEALLKTAACRILWFEKNFPLRRRLDTWLVYFILLLDPFSPSQRRKAVLRLGLRKGEEKRIFSYYRLRGRLTVSLSKKGLKPSKIFSLLEPLSYETIISFSASCRNKAAREYLADFFEVYNGMRLCVSGKDLGGLGLSPGPQYRRIFTRVLTAKLNGKLSNRRMELALIKKLAEKAKNERSR
ncbi:MAG: hypothetical protein PHQ84_02435 [Candidatus Omnitrophica bacterium]|jgi:tRNA nucleotidyltransferase (CCA-adding enzyme)|nr:hypothetical protein [Candidatus Omnitrophota bacterium]MDD3274141.1 hypothetical protein [Candidatus Omnitrophota bacterium]MDD5077839.1 hypothetical protein [Candidatus Omnitrophota bacterium]MDD5724585.1 hypothetical protein [Candidatus Omnitrophota bacterium]